MISVVMLVYNGSLYLREAIESILAQTLTDFELLIINDGSTDDSLAIINSYADSRLRVICNEKNVGESASRNIGLENAQGEYIAILDCDDVSLPQRLEKQLQFMKAYPQIGVSGSWVSTIGEQGSQLWQYPTHPEKLRCELLFHNVLANSSVMMRRNILLNNGIRYQSLGYAPDYALWVKLVQHNILLANIPEVLVYYRVHAAQLSRQVNHEHDVCEKLIYLSQLSELGIYPTTQELEIHSLIGKNFIAPTKELRNLAKVWLQKLQTVNQLSQYYPEPMFTQLLDSYLQIVCGECFR